MKLAVVGSQTGISRDFVNKALTEFVERVSPIDLVISGGAVGVDTFAEEWALGIAPVKKLLPDWKRYGKPGGPIRNQQIVNECDQIMIFWDGDSPGTRGTLKMALKSGKPITLFVRPG